MNDPAETIHYNAESAIEFKAVLFIPEKRPFDLMMNNDPKSTPKSLRSKSIHI